MVVRREGQGQDGPAALIAPCGQSGKLPARRRQRDDHLFATQNRCPHKQGPLAEGVAGGGKVICPLHSHKFDLATGQGSEPHECVKVFQVEERNGEVLLHR
ncbi:MAG: hypothetical protein EXS33_04010 [Pedosphaera sp.]|nr:hypothetical protein [Pedosphaera sp.]